MTLRGHTKGAEPCRKCGKIHPLPPQNFPRTVDLTPDFDLGWITGIVLGDGNVITDKKKRGITRLGSTDKAYVDLFASVAKKRFSNLTVGRIRELKTWQTPNGNWMTGTVYWARIYSKRLYEFFKPHKLPDFHWTIPPLVLSNVEVKRGFLQGIYDAEGSIYTDGQYDWKLQLSSKHKSNLVPIQPFLRALGMRSTWDLSHHPHCTLRVSGRNQCIQFRNKIGFRIPRKSGKLPTISQFKRRLKGREKLPWEMKTEW